MSNNDLSRILGIEKPIKSFLRNGEVIRFWNPADSPEAIYVELQDVLGDIATLDSEINQEGLKKEAELEAKRKEFNDEIAASEEGKPRGKNKSDPTRIAAIVAEINNEVEKFKNDRRNKQRTKRTPLYRRYLELIARQDKGAFESFRPSEIHALYATLKPIVERVLEDPSDFDPEDEPVGNEQATPKVESNGALKNTEMTLQPTSVG